MAAQQHQHASCVFHQGTDVFYRMLVTDSSSKKAFIQARARDIHNGVVQFQSTSVGLVA